MQSPLQTRLTDAAPQIAIQTIWKHDDDANFNDIRHCLPPSARPSQWQAWQSEVRASVITRGQLKQASSYLCGTWERSKNHPQRSNPEISGYEPQMTADALEELRQSLSPSDTNLEQQIQSALNLLQTPP
jgi:hypothetical protein